MNDGVKVVTPSNYLEPDEAAMSWHQTNFATGLTRPATARDWIEAVGSVHLDQTVPDEIHDLFAFAKNALGYGYFYYPVFTLVAQQLYRVADIAVDVLFDRLAIAPKPRSLDRRIVMLRERWLIDDEQYFHLDIMRRMRNSSTHGTLRTIIMPTHAIHDIRWIAGLISGLPWPETPPIEAQSANEP